MIFEDRHDAGKKLSNRLAKYKRKGTVIIALPRGGVPVGYEIARSLNAPLYVLPVRKLGLPHNPEYGIGAIAKGGVLYIDEKTVTAFDIPYDVIEAIAKKELQEMSRQENLYKIDQQLPILTDKIVILIDDGLATGVSAKAAIKAIKNQNPRKIIFAVPGCPLEAASEFRNLVDAFICLEKRKKFTAVANLYNNFRQVTDEEVITLLKKAQGKKT